VIDAGPVPLGLAATVIQGALEEAVQAQEEGSVRLRLRVPPYESKVTDAGLVTGSWHEPAS